MSKKIFQFLILCGLTASMNEAMAQATLGKAATKCEKACIKLTHHWKNKLLGEEYKGQIDSTSNQIGNIYSACLNNCTNLMK